MDYNDIIMNINLIRFSNSMDPNATFKQDSDQFIDDINNELFDDDLALVENVDSPFSIIFIETGGSEQKFIKEIDNLPRPIILLSNCKNNSLPACFEISTYCKKNKIRDIILFGEEGDIAHAIKTLSEVLTAKANIEKSRLGVIGKPSDWLIASTVDYQEVKNKFGVEIIDISTEELKEEIQKGVLKDIPHLSQLRTLEKRENVLEGALEIYSGLKRIIEKYHLNGFTLRCFDLLTEYKNTSCLAFGLLNEEGYIATCEGDVPSMLTMLFIKEALHAPSFQANPSKISLRESEILFAHCTVPLNMCKKYEFLTHFESDLGIGIRGTLENSDVTICKISPNLKDLLCVKGTIKENLTLPNYCRTQIVVKMDNENLFEFLNTSFGNHILVTYGDHVDTLLGLFHFFVE